MGIKIHIKNYTAADKTTWNTFVENSYNGTFIHHRDYMDYHADRFDDYSLMLYDNGKLIGLIPAHRIDNKLFSHNGLTFGDWINSKNFPPQLLVEIWKHVLFYLKQTGIDDFYLKEIPVFLTRYLSHRNRLAFTETGQINKKAWFSVIDTRKPLDKLLNTDRKQNLAKAPDVVVRESDDWPIFWNILQENLKRRHQTAPVHSLDEILLLRSNFPENIKLFGGYRNNDMLAGAVVYIYRNVFHFQYISTYPEGVNRRVIDKLIWELLQNHYHRYDFISLGTSEQQGKIYEPLAYWKYSFGAEPVEQLFWYFDVKNME